MDIILRAPKAAALIGAPSDRVLVEIYDPRYGAGQFHFTAGSVEMDGARSVEVEIREVCVSAWVGGDVVDVLRFDRAEFFAALAADGIEVQP